MAENAQAIENEELAADKEELIGDILRATRIHYGQSLQDIERTLRIRECQIQAIENGDIDKLPGRVYAIGFVRSYAEYLDLNGDRAVEMFKRQYLSGNAAGSKPSLPIPAEESKVPSFWLVVLSVLLVAAGVYYWSSLSYIDRTLVAEIPEVPERIEHSTAAILQPVEEVFPPAEMPEEAQESFVELGSTQQETSQDIQGIQQNVNENETSATTVAAEDVAGKKGIILNIREDSWVEIKDQNRKILVSEVLRTGDQYFVPDSPGLTMSLGNSGGVEIVVNGKALKPLGKTGEVRRNIPLKVEHLMQAEERLETQGETSETETPSASVPE